MRQLSVIRGLDDGRIFHSFRDFTLDQAHAAALHRLTIRMKATSPMPSSSMRYKPPLEMICMNTHQFAFCRFAFNVCTRQIPGQCASNAHALHSVDIHGLGSVLNATLGGENPEAAYGPWLC